MTEKGKRRQLDKASKLRPRPVPLPSGAWRCQVRWPAVGAKTIKNALTLIIPVIEEYHHVSKKKIVLPKRVHREHTFLLRLWPAAAGPQIYRHLFQSDRDAADEKVNAFFQTLIDGKIAHDFAHAEIKSEELRHIELK